MGRPRGIPLETRFWAQVDMRSGIWECWEWTGARLPRGYGFAWDNAVGANRLAHRLAWELTNGPIPDDLWVLHRCDNPPCVRPDHLFLGTAADNAHDMMAKGRGRRQRTRQGRFA